MKRLALILLLFSPLSLLATKHYVDPAGIDDAGRNGSAGQPWATLSYGCTRVSPPDTVYVNAGPYDEDTQVVWPAGVYIDGAGKGLVLITATAALNPIILASSSAGTNGNQSLSNITIDGDSLAVFGIRVIGRSNVSIHDIEIKRTIRYGVTYADQASRSVTVAPTTWATGNAFYNNIVTDCGRDVRSYYGYYTWEADAAIDISGQDGMVIADNFIDNKTGGRYAYGIKGLYGGGYHKNEKIYHNVIRTNIRDVVDEQSFGFNIELWSGGGIEIYENDCNGAIDMGGYGFHAYSYGYAFIVRDNTLIQDSRPTFDGEAGLILEGGGSGGMYFIRNWVENFSTGLTLGTTAVSLVQGFDNVKINLNIFCNLGFTSGGVGAGISGYNLSTGVTINDLDILNNVIHKINNASGWGVNFEYPTANTWTDVRIKNNIIFNAYTSIQFRYQTINGIGVDNNIIFGHTRSTIPDYTYSSVSNATFNNNKVGVNPLFATPIDFHLQATSPAIDAGTAVGLTTDYDGNVVPFNGITDMGAHEFGSYIIIPGPDGTALGKDKNGNLLKDKNGIIMIIQ